MRLHECLQLGLDLGLTTVREAVVDVEIHSMNYFGASKFNYELMELYNELNASQYDGDLRITPRLINQSKRFHKTEEK